MIRVTDTGAVGHGESDDAPALQRALEQHRPVHVPPGTYKVGSTLRIGLGTRLSVHPYARLALADGVGLDQSCPMLTTAAPFTEIDVRQSLRRLAASPFLAETLARRGFVYDVARGALREVAERQTSF